MDHVTEALLEDLENKIRAGQNEDVKNVLKSINLRNIDRSIVLRLANLARRAHMHSFALRILWPSIREKSHESTPQERAEYAANLLKIGASEEAHHILQALHGEFVPEVYLYESFYHMSRWDYESASLVLERYLRHLTPESYAAAVGQVNLAASFVYADRYQEAKERLQPLLQKTSEQSLTLLHTHCLELLALAEMGENQLEKAQQLLNTAIAQTPKTQTHSLRNLRKWLIVTELKRKTTPTLAAQLAELQLEAYQTGDWETVRDCDYQMGLHFNDLQILAYLYHGTPHEHFRDRILNYTQFKLTDASETFLWKGRFDGDNPNPTQIFNLKTAEVETSPNCHLKSGTHLYKLVQALVQDFYKPVTIGALFFDLYPDEWYDPEHSAPRIYVHIQRLREWMKEHHLPFQIIEKNGNYKMRILKEGAILKYTNEEGPQSIQEATLMKISALFGAAEFTARQVATAAKVSLATSQRVLKWGSEKGYVQKISSGPHTKYKIIAENFSHLMTKT